MILLHNDKYVKNEQKYLLKLNSFFSRPILSSTYKLYFMKSLLDLSKYNYRNKFSIIGQHWIKKENNTNLKIDLNFIAIRFIKYYAILYFKYRLKQSHSPKDANINKILEEYKNELGSNQILKSHKELLTLLSEEKFSYLRKDVIQRSIKPEVLVHFDKEKYLLRVYKKENCIEIETSLIRFFKRYHNILHAGINYLLTIYLEKINTLPRIAEKISEKDKRTRLKPEEEKILNERSNYMCFYCEKCPIEHMDHVIPFNYVFETKLFNIAPACSKCNSDKSDLLPGQEIFDRVKKRNKDLLILGEFYTDEWYQELYDSCRITYHGDRKFFDLPKCD